MGSKIDVWAKKGAYNCHFPLNIWNRGLKSIFSPAPWNKGVSNIYIFPSALKKGGLYRGTYPSHLHNEYPPPPGFDVKRNDSQILNSMNSNTLLYVLCKQIQIDVLVQERRNSSALALELRTGVTSNPSKCRARCHCCGVACTAAPFARKLCVP